jgi:hypothetical protein
MKIDQALLEAALVGYLHRKDEVEAKIAEIRQELNGNPSKSTTPRSGNKTREMSAAARERIAAAQRKRWAAYHKSEKEPTQKRRLSPAARKRIADATKKRWAAYRAQKAAAQQG